MDIAQYVVVTDRERLLAHTFGSQDWLWDTLDFFRSDPADRKLVGAELRMPYISANAETTVRVPVIPAVYQGGLRADEVRDFRHETCTVLCRAAGDAVLICLPRRRGRLEPHRPRTV